MAEAAAAWARSSREGSSREGSSRSLARGERAIWRQNRARAQGRGRGAWGCGLTPRGCARPCAVGPPHAAGGLRSPPPPFLLWAVPRATWFLRLRSVAVSASELVLMDKYVVKRSPREVRSGSGGKRPRPEEPGPASAQPLWQEIRAEGLSCDYRLLFAKAEADRIFQQLEEEVEYFEGEMTKLQVFGKWHNIPRKQVTYGDPELTYTYSGVTFSPKPWIPVLQRIRDRLTLDTGHTFNFVLINRYKDGEDHIGEHRDDEKELVPRSPIASVSFGACRDFVFRHCDSRGKKATRHIKPIKLQLAHGSLLMMKYPTNVYWYHSLPTRKRVLAPRINLTFRKVRTVVK